MLPLLFASCLLAGCCVPPVLHHHLLSTSQCTTTALQCAATSCLSFAGLLSCCISSCRLHLASPFFPPPPYLSILDPPPSFALTGCCITSHCAASASHPLANPTASSRADDSTIHLPLVRSDWLPCCLLWHLSLSSTSLPSPQDELYSWMTPSVSPMFHAHHLQHT